MKKKIKDLRMGDRYFHHGEGRIFEIEGNKNASVVRCKCVYSADSIEIGKTVDTSAEWKVEVFPESPRQKRMIKQLYRLNLKLSNQIFGDHGFLDGLGEVKKDRLRGLAAAKNRFKKIVGMEPK